jgi:Zn ribbon nucleic-acid-binding protein
MPVNDSEAANARRGLPLPKVVVTLGCPGVLELLCLSNPLLNDLFDEGPERINLMPEQFIDLLSDPTTPSEDYAAALLRLGPADLRLSNVGWTTRVRIVLIARHLRYVPVLCQALMETFPNARFYSIESGAQAPRRTPRKDLPMWREEQVVAPLCWLCGRIKRLAGDTYVCPQCGGV